MIRKKTDLKLKKNLGQTIYLMNECAFYVNFK